MKEVIKLGQLLGSKEQRDAVHVAILPCIAHHELNPGERVAVKKFRNGYVALSLNLTWDEGVGVVDPFLKHPVAEGHHFYVLLDPNTITSLRHNWTHPAIEDEDEIR